MSDRVFVLRCVTGSWTNWQPQWVLEHGGVYEYTGDDTVLTFSTVAEAEAWVRTYRKGWWLELPASALYGR